MDDRASNIGYATVSELCEVSTLGRGPVVGPYAQRANLPEAKAFPAPPQSLLELAEYTSAAMRDLADNCRITTDRLCGAQETKMPEAIKPKSQDFATRMRDAVQEIDALRYRIAEDLSRIDSALR